MLAGAAEQLRETTGAPLSPMGRQRLDHWLVPLRQAVGEQGVAGARAQSRTLGVEQAMALALASADVAPPASADGQHRPEEQASVLTRRERQVAALVGRGLSNRQIATELVITERTAGSHIEHILDKLNLGSRTQVGVWASQQGLLGPGSA